MDASTWKFGKPATRRGRRVARLLLISAAAAVVLLIGGAATAVVLDSSGVPATITSDQPDYAPGATVTLTGANWASGETVHIVVNDTIGQTWQHVADQVADSA